MNETKETLSEKKKKTSFEIYFAFCDSTYKTWRLNCVYTVVYYTYIHMYICIHNTCI